MKKPQLLAPAGSLKKLKIAFKYGADAVYIGLPAYSLRAKTDFDLKSIKAGIDYAHKLGKKVYITINIFAYNRHFKLLPQYLKQIKKYQPDAIIVSDPGVLAMVKKILPQMAIHLSTQMNTLNYEAVKFWQKQGVSRIILGREASLKDIIEIHKKVPKMELEIFVHGAMCMSYSGRCYLSAWQSGRSANLGLCTQPCRWNYKVYLEEELRPGEMIPIETDQNGTYIMNSKDLNLMAHLADLIKAGLISFKIEGRTKSIYYLAVAVRAYRQAIDLITPKTKNQKAQKQNLKLLEQELNKIDNRGYTTGFLLGNESYNREEFKTSKAMSDWEFVGEIIKTQKSQKAQKQIIYIRPHNALDAGEEVEIITPNNTYKTKFKEFFSEKGKSLAKIRGGTEDVYQVEISSKYDIVDMSLIRKKK
ncbi:MAG: U32 family peptidase C-terminal domain-containing protein [Candidatus Buchananbacteria bacterium]|nr:U32 family peptidase C-terminal domain-containing protein [Candidatus Buchananbacteria bacterium]